MKVYSAISSSKMLYILFTIFSYLLIVKGELPLPSYIKPCARTDENFNECAKWSGMAAKPNLLKGDRNLKIPPLDPLDIPHIEAGSGDDNSPTRIRLILNNTRILGIADVVIEEVKHDFEGRTIYYRLQTPKVIAFGKYNISAQVLVVPIRGAGDYNITLYGMTVHIYTSYDLKKADDGKTYVSLLDIKLGYDITGFNVRLENLFDGNEQLGNEVNAFLNENWKDASNAVGPIIAEALSVVYKKVMDEVTKNIPYDVAFPEKIP